MVNTCAADPMVVCMLLQLTHRARKLDSGYWRGRGGRGGQGGQGGVVNILACSKDAFILNDG